jgi:hypothetical protein
MGGGREVKSAWLLFGVLFYGLFGIVEMRKFLIIRMLVLLKLSSKSNSKLGSGLLEELPNPLACSTSGIGVRLIVSCASFSSGWWGLWGGRVCSLLARVVCRLRAGSGVVFCLLCPLFVPVVVSL